MDDETRIFVFGWLSGILTIVIPILLYRLLFK